jgi:hypothetical protein
MRVFICSDLFVAGIGVGGGSAVRPKGVIFSVVRPGVRNMINLTLETGYGCVPGDFAFVATSGTFAAVPATAMFLRRPRETA